MRIISRTTFCCGTIFRLTRVFFQLMRGVARISRLPKPVMSIFGGARLAKADPYFQQAHELAGRLAQAGISVVTGGGPGAMEAASCGAYHHAEAGKGRSIGISVRDLGEGKNPCTHEYLELDYFFARKWLLTRYSSGFVVFPGGFGTLDELAEVLTLMQTKKLAHVPIVLIGREYWHKFVEWLEDEVLRHGLVDEAALGMFTVTDDIDVAFKIIRDGCCVPSQEGGKS